MRAIWTGALSFGLVNIPVKLYTATNGQGISFNYLHGKDLAPVRYAKVCRIEGKEIPFKEIVKGYEYNEGEYVVIEEEEIEKANPRRAKTIDIQTFAKESEINPIYYEKPYYLEPAKGAEKAYALMVKALTESKKVAICRFVIRTREHLAAIKGRSKVLVMDQLRFFEEVRPTNGLTLPSTELVSSRELEMALRLIDQLSESFDPKKYKDTYSEELMRIINEKVKGKRPSVKGKAPEPTRVTDLMQVLRASLKQVS